MHKGLYVDVGCNKPIKNSNTFNLYLSGWTGINIDANEELIRKCMRIRKKDKSICEAVSDEVKEVTFYLVKESQISTLDEKYYNSGRSWWEQNTLATRTVKTRTLSSILDQKLSPGRKIDLLSVDVEGHDLNVLRGLDFNRYRPRVILVEIHNFNMDSDNEIHRFLTDKQYSLFSYSVLTGVYVSTSEEK